MPWMFGKSSECLLGPGRAPRNADGAGTNCGVEFLFNFQTAHREDARDASRSAAGATGIRASGDDSQVCWKDRRVKADVS